MCPAPRHSPRRRLRHYGAELPEPVTQVRELALAPQFAHGMTSRSAPERLARLLIIRYAESRHSRTSAVRPLGAMCGRLRVGKKNLTSRRWSVQPCVRPVCAVRMTAGHNALRGSVPVKSPHSIMQWHLYRVRRTWRIRGRAGGRYGSNCDMAASLGHVRSSPNFGHWSGPSACPKSTQKRK
jgi:hypothetical protein